MNRISLNVIAAMALLGLLFVGKVLFIPLAYALLLAMVLHPGVAGMERRGIPRILAITASMTGVAILFAAIIGLLSWQSQAFLEELPALRERSTGTRAALMEWIQGTAVVLPRSELGPMELMLAVLPENLSAMFVRLVEKLFGMLFNLFIIPLIAALILYDRKRFVLVLMELVGPSLRTILPDVIHRSIRSFSRFIWGTAKVYVIVGVLNSIGLMALGVDNAILYGMLSALMTIIPYIGIAISSLLPMSMVWLATGSLWYPFGVVLIYGAVQYLEANLIYPRIVGRQLNLNTLSSIVIVLAGALLWGASGMILALPFLAIVKIISSEVPSLRGLHLLIGNEATDQRTDDRSP